MAGITMRNAQRALRLSLISWSSPWHCAASCGLDSLEQPCRFRVQSSARLPAVQEFSRSSTTSAYPAPSNVPFGNYGSDLQEYHRVISALNYKRRPNFVRDVYEDMLLDGVQPIRDTFYLLITGCMKGTRLQDIVYFFDEMKAMGLTPDVALYNCFIAACGKSLQVDRAFQVAEEMEASGMQPRHRTFLALLRSCALAGRVDEAYGVVRRMAASGLTLDNQFYCALIYAHKNKKPYTKETVDKKGYPYWLSVVDLMKHGSRIAPEKHGSRVAPGMLQIFELLEQSKQASPEDLMAVAATGESEGADDIEDGLLNFLAEDIQPRRGFVNRRLVVYHAAVAALTSLGNKEAVQKVVKLIEQDGLDPDAYCTIQLIKCCLAEGDFEQACSEYNTFLEAGRQPTLELYIVLIDAALTQCSPTTSAVAQKLLVELGQKGFFLNGVNGTQLLLRACQGHTRDIGVANLVWDMMKSRQVKINKFVTNEYYKALERSNLPKDDPRLTAIRALVDQDSPGAWKINSRPGLTESEQMTPLEQVLYTQPQGDVEVDDVSSVEADGSFETLDFVTSQEKY